MAELNPPEPNEPEPNEPEPTQAFIVLAKEPAPGRAKTRLQERFTPAEASQLAAAAIRDTVGVVAGIPETRSFLSWQGFGGAVADTVGAGSSEFTVLDQDSGHLGDRLAGSFRRAWAEVGSDPPPRTVLVGMDTPQLSSADLDVDWRGVDAVLGLAPDGGFWAIGLRGGDPAAVFAGVPMSTSRTGAAQLARLHQLGLRVALLPPLSDVDTPADADAVAARHPDLEFSRVHRDLSRAHPGTASMFDQVYDGAAVTTHGSCRTLRLDPDRWHGPADEVDAMVAARCRGPVIDLGCGPGRLVEALLAQGIPALGVDVSEVAVRSGRARGAVALRRDILARLPLEGRWATVVLLDSNIGLGGDVVALLLRARDLVVPGGMIICEVDPEPGLAETGLVELAGPDGRCATLPWSQLGSEAVIRAAGCADLVVTEQWRAGGREFLGLSRP